MQTTSERDRALRGIVFSLLDKRSPPLNPQTKPVYLHTLPHTLAACGN